MKNKLLFITLISFLFAATSCQKDLTGNAITIEASANMPIDYFYIYESCSYGPGGSPFGTPDSLNGDGNGNYTHQIESGYGSGRCFTITGTIQENTDTVGKTILTIDAFYTEEENVVGFYDLVLKRPHADYFFRYEFQPEMYIE